jgi:hypothetical protein
VTVVFSLPTEAEEVVMPLAKEAWNRSVLANRATAYLLTRNVEPCLCFRRQCAKRGAPLGALNKLNTGLSRLREAHTTLWLACVENFCCMLAAGCSVFRFCEA